MIGFEKKKGEGRGVWIQVENLVETNLWKDFINWASSTWMVVPLKNGLESHKKLQHKQSI